MQYTNLIWRDGQPYSEQFDDIYYSSDEAETISGESEFDHVFFKNNGLPERWQGAVDFVIAELGFGSGLNCILTMREWLNNIQDSNQTGCLHYIALEKYPLSPEAIVELISRYPELRDYCEELINNYPPAVEGTHSRHLFGGRVIIHYKFMDAYKALQDERFKVDCWYLDGFSPAKNPDMWSEELFQLLAKNSRQGTTCSTYTAAGFVKRHLANAGFTVTKVKGYGKKREMLTASFSGKQKFAGKYADKPWFVSPSAVDFSSKKATVIGAGIAGLSVAYSLVRRGWNVTVIDRHGDVARETSGNPAVIVYPRLSVNNDVDTEFYSDAHCYNQYVLETLQKKHQQKFWFDCGLLQVADRKRISEIIKKFRFNENYVSIHEDKIEHGRLSDQQVYAEYKSAGVVLPRVLCEVLKQECGDSLTLVKAEITEIKRSAGQWSCLSGEELIDVNDILILADATAAKDLALVSDFPIECVRGQVAIFNENSTSKNIRKVMSADKHITPAINDKHYLGATYSRNNTSLEIDTDETMQLFNSINDNFPDLIRQEDYCDAWAGFRAMAKDRVPIVGAMPDEKFFNEEYADIKHGSTKKNYQPASYLSGVYVSAAHGSRGFTSSFISAEIIAALLHAVPAPVSKRVMDYLGPSRFIVNDLKGR